MSLEEFLAQTDYNGTDITALSDADAAIAANAYEVTETVKIEGATRKTAVETVNIFNGTQERLEAFTPNEAMTAEQQATAVRLAKMIVKAFKNLYNPEFYINLAEPQVQGAYAGAVALGVLTPAEYKGILLAGTKVSKPLENTTEQDVLFIRNGGEASLTKQQVAYPSSMTYLIATAREGVDVEINTDIDTTFDLYLDVCADSADQNVDENYIPTFNGGVVGTGVSINGKAIISLGSRKLRGYNRLYVKPRLHCTFTASATTNRG